MTATQQDSGTGGGPTVLRMLLGSHLRQLREDRGITREAAGYEIRSSESKISRMELGRVSFKERDVADLLTLYGVIDSDERDRLLALARDANTPGWWHRFGDVLPSWFQSYLGLEAAASMIRSYEVQFVPGLLQTEDYTRGVVRLRYEGASLAEVEQRVQLRMNRQKVLTQPNPPQVWLVIDEAVLRRPIGGEAVMRAQIAAMLEATERPNVRLQVIPFHVGGHSETGGAFTILRFPDRDLPDVIYVEQLTSAIYLDKRDDVDQYAATMERLCVEALPPAKTRDFLRDILADA